ncbi:PepSY domain-containing protein [Abyssalbus ytuae]|uniref:PepSY domain-containing protein n=1 Tax=Abyssalbus ytuae TaxID=2926907 RepID=A0A9E6ZLQ2_9FLAO|nr:PepSY domain-containing protein [Abyssalbus ytuae]UOB16485.1 PepSY domain-containing protein [Abyssalbus ytuae]
MVSRHTALKIRKLHRYLGIFTGVQFLLWTVSGLYFSWTNIDNIHGDHFKKTDYNPAAFNSLISPSQLKIKNGIHSVELRDIDHTPYYWINDEQLYNAFTGTPKNNITRKEAIAVARQHLVKNLKVKYVHLIQEAGKHHEYRNRSLPSYVISYENNNNLKAYVSAKDGKFQTIRHTNWRWFDFLWMTHTMDYEGRDNFNTTVLRTFSLLGLITVLSGFLLWSTSSPSIRKLLKRKNK